MSTDKTTMKSVTNPDLNYRGSNGVYVI
ncbi:unnamed protein product, partial [Rotaria sordida]